MMSSNTFKILSIDGGGIKGLYSAVILADFEEKYGSIYKHFDLICGTSTGGIIALGLASGVPAKDIVDLYKYKGKQIFPSANIISKSFNTFKQALVKSKYSEKALKEELREVFGEKKVKDCLTNVLIPTSNITKGTPCVIKSDHSKELGRDGNHLLVDVALATSAAPTYFPVQTIETMPDPTDQFSDGGLYANNPSLYGIQEANKWFIKEGDQKYENYRLLSISTLHQNFAFKRKLKVKSRSLLLWNKKLLQLMMDLQSIATHYHIEYSSHFLDGHYVRIHSEDLTKSESKSIELDNASMKSIQIL